MALGFTSSHLRLQWILAAPESAHLSGPLAPVLQLPLLPAVKLEVWDAADVRPAHGQGQLTVL